MCGKRETSEEPVLGNLNFPKEAAYILYHLSKIVPTRKETTAGGAYSQQRSKKRFPSAEKLLFFSNVTLCL